MRILLVDDDQDFVDLTGFALRRQGHRVAMAHDAGSAQRQVLADQPDLVLLSTTIPSSDGVTLCREIRERSVVPIIILSSHGDETALVRGYEAGADDYVVKPFSPRQLLLRIDAVMRRWAGGSRDGAVDEHRRIYVGDLVFDPARFEVCKNGARISLTQLEFRILSMLVRSTGMLVESGRLIEYAWWAPARNHRALLKTHISHIRHKLTGAGGVAIWIQSVARLGYMLSFETGDAAPHPVLSFVSCSTPATP